MVELGLQITDEERVLPEDWTEIRSCR